MTEENPIFTQYNARLMACGASAYRLCKLAGINWSTWWRIKNKPQTVVQRNTLAKMERAMRHIERENSIKES